MKIILLIFYFILFFGCKESNKVSNIQENKISENFISIDKKIDKNYSGTWIYTEIENNCSIPALQFTLTIYQNGDIINGQYCAIANSGGKIDCESEKEYNIKGRIINGKIVGSFYSFFGSPKDVGEFEIAYINDNVVNWKIIKTPNGLFYAPNSCNLKKENKISTNKSDNIFPLNNKNQENLSWKESSEFENYNNIYFLPKSQNISVILAKNDLGDDEFYTLFTQNEKTEIIDSLKIGYVEDDYSENNKRIITEFTITPDYEIFLNIYEKKDNKKKDNKKIRYTISGIGKFVRS